jgi:hypothetical protein
MPLGRPLVEFVARMSKDGEFNLPWPTGAPSQDSSARNPPGLVPRTLNRETWAPDLEYSTT